MSNQKLGQYVKSQKNFVNILEATVNVQFSSNLLRMIILRIFLSSADLDIVWLKTRSVGQILEKPGEHSRGQDFALS